MGLFGESCIERCSAALIAALCAACVAPERPAPPLVTLSVGRIGITDGEDFNVYGAEYRFRTFSEWRLAPTLGVILDEDGASYASAGLTREFWLDERWAAVPSLAVGLFEDGRSIRLGSELEFRSGIELAHRFENGLRLGLGFFHLSNGGIAERNPGAESLVLSLGIPVGE